MERTRRLSQNSQRMDSARSGSICRHFLNGFCRYGARCCYRHEWPVRPSPQICRYFQKGGCWYGDSCRYRHIRQPEVDTTFAGRRASVPTFPHSRHTYSPIERRGSEATVLLAEVMNRQQFSRSESLVNMSNFQHDVGYQPANITVEQSQETHPELIQSVESHWNSTQSLDAAEADLDAGQRSDVAETNSESAQTSDVAQAGACQGRNEEAIPSSDAPEDGASAAAASSTQSQVEEMEAFIQSKDVTCGICMDTVYEKTDPRNRVFAILPNCNHSFCLQCIMTWRKTKDLGPDVVKTCPQCRVRSPFYVPHKYWVQGEAKTSVIAAFKDKFGKKCCGYYARYRWCPFKTECLYRHDRHAHHASLQYPTEDEDEDECDGVDLLNFFIAMTLLGDDDDDDEYDFPFYLAAEYGF
ncbi:makorin, ring finger protein, 4 [Mugil cephalus]|uniref:makorin, ring finger protein, 4 n=1 Tax=Mugil cephalus TaxID=48193 RepID=UPI001FB85FC1|nr:makorin, ring finger protein, 4 [Mugil cephalus]